MAQDDVNVSYQLARLDSASDCSTNKDDSVRGGCAVDIGKDIGSPFVLIKTKSRDDDGHVRRTGNVWTASAHVITAVIGSGVLSLAWSIAQIGWVAGPLILLAFAFVTYYTALLLANCYRYPDPVTGRRNYTYMEAVKAHLGEKHVWLCGIVQYVNLIGTSIGYTITSSISMVAIARSNCFHKHGHDAKCHTSHNPYTLLFGAVQIVLSQIPDFNRLWWLSIVAAVMSFSYSSVGLGLAIGKASEKGHSHGTLTGVSLEVISKEKKTWSVFQALGNIAFAYSFTVILIEIQDTLKSPPAENKTMKRASLIGIVVTTLFYMSVGCFGYAAFGDTAPGNMLTGFGFYNPYWLVDFANACIVVHLVGAYQVFTQPVFAFSENWMMSRWSKHAFVTYEQKVPMPFQRPFKLSVFKVIWRTLFVITTTVVSMLIPFFNDVLGLLGATAFWPLTVYFPITMHISQNQLKRWSSKWIALQCLSCICLLISLSAGIGSMAGIIIDLKRYTPFKTQY
ncbi:hypothetical protein GOP47_0010759 [Adiantum capillus-veneris]|uniref:Amino acid transporter transmembrane domain-containing protein n=1 Tax=Adiantum capillus-veneris TaxID=13818 RepID=A0A9D4ZGN7_ADICA|nr:hypothetical protein GOP47_0010759 [Adiantum capillus-veneris]